MQRTGENKLGELLNAYVDEVHIRERFEALDVGQAWLEAVGARAAAATSGSYFRDGVLYCNMNSSIIRNRLYFNLDAIIVEINRRLGKEAVRKIVLR